MASCGVRSRSRSTPLASSMPSPTPWRACGKRQSNVRTHHIRTCAVVLTVRSDMAHFLASVRQSMLASRRTQPIPHDFLYALTSHQLSLTSLLPHLDPPVEHSQTQSLLQIAPQSFPDTRAEEAVIAKLLHEPIATATATVAPMPLPRTFPALPSWHTYKASPVFARRELDPKTIRERATEEGRRGEEALRRLVSRRPPEKHKGKEPQQPSQPSQPPASPVAGRTVTQREERRPEKQRTHDLWMETMNAVVREFPAQPGSREATPNPGAAATAAAETPQELFLSGHVPPPVNWDRVHWRKPPKAVSSQSRAQDVVMGNG